MKVLDFVSRAEAQAVQLRIENRKDEARRLLAHKAGYEGEIAAGAIAGRDTSKRAKIVPSVIFTDPNVASAGWTEQQAREAGVEVDAGKLQLGAVGKPHAIDEPLGLVKTVVAKDDGKILGIHLVGAEACELIAEAVLAIEAGVTFAQFEHVIHPHPTLSEALKEAVLAARDEAIHVIGKR